MELTAKFEQGRRVDRITVDGVVVAYIDVTAGVVQAMPEWWDKANEYLRSLDASSDE